MQPEDENPRWQLLNYVYLSLNTRYNKFQWCTNPMGTAFRQIPQTKPPLGPNPLVKNPLGQNTYWPKAPPRTKPPPVNRTCVIYHPSLPG